MKAANLLYFLSIYKLHEMYLLSFIHKTANSRFDHSLENFWLNYNMCNLSFVGKPACGWFPINDNFMRNCQSAFWEIGKNLRECGLLFDSPAVRALMCYHRQRSAYWSLIGLPESGTSSCLLDVDVKSGRQVPHNPHRSHGLVYITPNDKMRCHGD